MSAHLLPGDGLAARIREGAARRAAAFHEAKGRRPKLAVLSIGSLETAEAYLRRNEEACRLSGLGFEARRLPAGSSQRACEDALSALSRDPAVDGILTGLPLPPGLSADGLLAKLDPEKDVEGLTPTAMGRLYGSRTIEEARARAVWPCTAEAILALLEQSGVSPEGSEAVVIGRSSLVGRPAAHLLACLNATVTLCHSKTRDIQAHVDRADIVVCATGSPGWLKRVKPGAVVLDAGIHYRGGRAVGDADPSVAESAGFLTPVPGGVGPVTVSFLLEHVAAAAERRAAPRP